VEIKDPKKTFCKELRDSLYNRNALPLAKTKQCMKQQRNMVNKRITDKNQHQNWQYELTCTTNRQFTLPAYICEGKCSVQLSLELRLQQSLLQTQTLAAREAVTNARQYADTTVHTINIAVLLSCTKKQ